MYNLPFETLGLALVLFGFAAFILCFLFSCIASDYRAGSLDRLYARRAKAQAKADKAARNARLADDKATQARYARDRAYDRRMGC